MTPCLFAWILAVPPAPIGPPPASAPALQATHGSPLKAAPPPTMHALFGVVTEQAPLECTPGAPGEWPVERWGAPYYEIGFVRLVDPAFDPAPLVGRPVLALGAPRDGPAPLRPDPCLAHQMRSDWIYGRHGIRVRRTSPPHVAFHPSSVTPLGAEVLTARRTGDQVEITFNNPLDRPLTDLVLTLHHEGCYGKPLATERAAATPALGPGESFTARLPAIVAVEGRRGHHHAAAAVTIAATGERVGFDLDVPLAALGAAVACPERAPE